MPLLRPCLADVGRARTELEKAFELGVLIAVGGVDVDVQPGFPLLRLIPAAEDDRRLRTTEPFARPDLHRAVVLTIEHDEVQDLAPEPRQHLRVAAVEHELTDATCHNETSSQPGNCRQATPDRHGPSSENNPATVPDEASTGETISGPALSRQPGKRRRPCSRNTPSRRDAPSRTGFWPSPLTHVTGCGERSGRAAASSPHSVLGGSSGPHHPPRYDMPLIFPRTSPVVFPKGTPPGERQAICCHQPSTAGGLSTSTRSPGRGTASSTSRALASRQARSAGSDQSCRARLKVAQWTGIISPPRTSTWVATPSSGTMWMSGQASPYAPICTSVTSNGPCSAPTSAKPGK